MVGGEAVGVEATPADPDQRRLHGQATADELCVEGGELGDRVGAAECVANVEERMVEAGADKLRRGAPLREGVGKHHAPAPRIAGQRCLGLDDPGRLALEQEAVPHVAVPAIDRLTGEGEVG